MANLKQNYIVKQNSEVFSYLPAPPDKNIFLHLTSFGHEFLENDYYLEREFSDVYMINYIAQGSLNFIYNGVKHTLNKGDLSFFYIGEHNVVYPTSENTEIYFFHISGEGVKNYYHSITQKNGHVFNDFTHRNINKFFNALKNTLNKDYFISTSLKITEFLLNLYSTTQEKKQNYPPLIEKIFQHIIDRNLNVKSLAKLLGYSPIYLERYFKTYTGKTISEYLLKRKFDEAQNLILYSDLSVNQIAEKVGYASSKGLIILFKNQTGLTPLEYKKIYKKTK